MSRQSHDLERAFVDANHAAGGEVTDLVDGTDETGAGLLREGGQSGGGGRSADHERDVQRTIGGAFGAAQDHFDDEFAFHAPMIGPPPATERQHNVSNV